MAQLPVSDFDKAIGKRIQIRRKECHLTADVLSEKIGMSQQQLSRYERGANKVNITHLIHIAQILDTPLFWFLQDCIPAENFDSDGLKHRLDFHWRHISQEQKQSIINLLDTFHTTE
ncbi:hypothetical protein PL75_08240 [Neisseria arctica]|uniref:HTH cro/C1-type domain-containing protein n=1 Tax=Neisseria arctica TaxID=1470200 RepID=A0A0J0YQI3_9NEIS|nr:helix-turn-helix transcriptional regulator [Neisseria arctica]KLT72377.1 hypothetical protein PL75_08240 [Neisseria arctica]UOO86050.1 helix-turn-helix domain-containing protein [Neisseria arctica]